MPVEAAMKDLTTAKKGAVRGRGKVLSRSHGKLHASGSVGKRYFQLALKTQHVRPLMIPTSILKKAGIRPGSELDVDIQQDGSIVIRAHRSTTQQIKSDLRFEDCLAEVLALRESALKRLAE
jgi:antitoxin component of MazEF toxin-antitoxin module